MKLQQAALAYHDMGLSAIPTDSSKRSICTWKKYENTAPAKDEIIESFSKGAAKGLAIICGASSGGLEIIDCDIKYDVTGTLWQRLQESLNELTLFGKLVVVSTIGGGYHLYYRCEQIEGNQKLAQRATTEAERQDNPNSKVRVLIETRGQAGYVIAPPSEGYKIQQGSLDSITVLSIDERDRLLACCRSFNELVEEVPITYRHPTAKSSAKSPFTDYNERGDVEQLLERHGWRIVKTTNDKTTFLRPGETKSKSSGDYNRTLGLFGVFTTSSEFTPMKGYRPAAVFCKLECADNWKECYRKLTDMGYGEQHIKISPDLKIKIKNYADAGLQQKEIATLISKESGYNESQAQKIVHQATSYQDGLFEWQGKKRAIVYRNYVDWLKNNNYHLYFYDGSPIYKLIKIHDGKVKEANNYMIKQELLAKINADDYESEEDRALDLETLIKNPNIFLNNIYEYLEQIDIQWLRDDANTCYIPFESCIVRITKDKTEKLTYGSFKEMHIWDSELKVNEKWDSIDIIDDEAELTCQFGRFIELICGGDDQRILSACTIIGYLLHKHKDPSRAWAVILGEETDDETKGGGTGKGIFIKALEKILNTVTIDGKNFKADKSFAYQRVKLDTRLVAIQDVDRIFDFEKFYSIITEGWTIEKKNKDELYIGYKDSPKVILTTNYTISDTGHHAKRRQKVVEFSDYFGAHRTPKEEFGMLMFDDWDRDEWNRFFNYMFRCVKIYFNLGVVDVTQGERYRLKKLRTQFGEDFAAWFTETAIMELKSYQKFTDVYKNFLGIHDFDKKDFSIKKFKKGMSVAAENYQLTIKERIDRQGNNVKLIKLESITP